MYAKKKFSTDDNDKIYYKVRDHCHSLENMEALQIDYLNPNT